MPVRRLAKGEERAWKPHTPNTDIDLQAVPVRCLGGGGGGGA